MKRQITSLILAVATLLSILTVPAGAVSPRDGSTSLPDTIKMTDCDASGNSYVSAGIGQCYIHQLKFDVSGENMIGFCAEHGKGMGWSLEGQTWGHPKPVTDPNVITMMAYFYAHVTGKFTDQAKAIGEDKLWNSDYIWVMDAWVQAIIWRYKEGLFADPATACAEELMSVYNGLKGGHYTSIDDLLDGKSFRDRAQYILELGSQGVWGDCTIQEYKYTGSSTSYQPANNVQAIMIGKLNVTYEKYSLIIKKVDSTNPNKGLPGARFKVTSENGAYSREVVTGSDGSVRLNSLDASTYAIVELEAPEGYEIDNAGPQYVTLPNGGNKTVTVTFADTPTITSEGSIRKVDADDPTKGLAGAVIKITGVDNDFVGTYVTGEGGYLTDVPWDSMPIGSYTAEEVTPPEGYSKSSDQSKVKQSFHWDGKSDVSLVFENDAKVKVELIKLDDSDNPLPGAVFNIVKDGQIIGTEATKADGSITVTDVTEGMYAFVEVSAPAPYATLTEPVFAHVDQATINGGGTVTVTATDQKLPSLTILKKDGQTSTVIPGTTFEVRGISNGYHNDVVTGPDGRATLSNIPVGSYEVTEKSVPDPYTLGEVTTQTIYLGPGDNRELVFDNLKQPEITISKVALGSGEKIPGTVFTVSGIDSDYRNDITTGADGTVTLRVAPGSYRVIEKSVPEPYCLPENEMDCVQTVSLNAGDSKEIIFKNAKKPLLTIAKIDADTNDIIPGTVFTIEGVSNDYRNDVTTGADGTVSLRLAPGSYKITEKSVPAPYYLPSKNADREQTVSLNPGDEKTVTFKDHKAPELTIFKEDSVAGAPIEGAKFHVTYTSNGEAAEAPGSIDYGYIFTDANGQIKVHEQGKKMYPGEYTVTEVAPAPGFQMKEPTTQKVIIHGGESKTLTFQNEPLNGIIVEKYDSVTHEALPGCTFQLRYLGGTSGTGGTVIGQKVTGKNGTAIWTGLKSGTYVVEEVDPADGYSIINASETVYLADSGEQSIITVRFDNAPDGILLIRKVCSVNPSITLQDAEFKIMYADGTLIGDSNGIYHTDENGEIRIPGLKPGKSVVVTETRAPAGFIIDTQSQTVQIKEGRTVSLTFKNQPKGAIIIQKRDSSTGQPLSGAEFRVTTAAGCEVGLDGVIGNSTLTQNGLFTTDSNGEIRITNLAPGAYVVTEIKAPAGYVMDSPSTNVVIGQGGDTQTVIVKNSKAGTLVIDKRDALTGKPLQGVTFKVTTSTGEYVPDASGQISSNGLYFTDKDGKITINGVVGTLVVTETATIPGYTIDEATRTQTVDVRPNDTQTLHFTNTPSTTLVIEKYIEGTTTPLKGVTFLVTDSSGAVVGNSNGEFITDENGRIVLDGLTPGTTVTAREVKALEGYVLDGQPKSILIKAGEVQTLRFYNVKQGTIVVKKLDKQTGKPLAGVEFQITYSDGSYLDDDYGHLSSKGLYKTDTNGEIRISGVVGTLVITETKPLPGYVMDEGTRTQTVKVNASDTQTITVYNTKVGGLTIIKKDEETGKRISGVQFEIRKLNGEIIGTYTTDRSGVISLPEAEKGWYQVTELKAAKGYQLDSQPYQVEVKDGGTATLEITNRQIGSAIIHKIDSVTGKGIFGVKFLLSDAKGNPVGTYESDNEGYVYVDGGLADGKYTVREIECADGYILDTQPKTIYVEYGGCTTITWKNTAITGQLQITKTSADYNSMNGWPAGTPIPGTVFEVYHYRTGNLVDTIRTDKNGVAVSKPLPLGRYKVVESKAADFYALDKTPIDVEIEHAGQIVKAAMTNKSLYTNVSIEKTGYAEVMPGQNIRYTFSNIANNSTTALTSFYWRDTLPVEAVRLAKITTGTYNAAGSYKIVYKTNLSGADYRVLADSLNTQQNYVLEASPVALRLASNEYVTEVMFVFGVVPANFRQVEAPKIDCTVVSWAKGGSQFVNQADVGGVYNGQWIMATTRWVTKVYAPSKPLPRTGY